MTRPGESAYESVASEEELAERNLLVGACDLSADQVARADDYAIRQRASFAAAVIELGFATSREVERLIRAAYRQPIPAKRAVILHPTARQPGSALVPVVRPDPTALPAPELMALVAPGSETAETLRALRTQILLRVGSNASGIALAIVSTGAGDGRSRVASELAVSLAQLKRSVLLVDADLRNPALRRYFSIATETPGLAHSLGDDITPECFLVEGMASLSFIPSGEPDAASLELFSDRRFHDFIAACRQHYDFVIVDTPAAAMYADALAVASAAGHAILVVRAARTATRDARELLEKLSVAGARVVGAVLSHF